MTVAAQALVPIILNQRHTSTHIETQSAGQSLAMGADAKSAHRKLKSPPSPISAPAPEGLDNIFRMLFAVADSANLWLLTKLS